MDLHLWKYRMGRLPADQVVLMIEEINDPAVIDAARARRERFSRNAAWLEAHRQEIFARYRGKCICVAGQEAFVADTSPEAVAQAKFAHPDDDGRFIYRVPLDKAIRVYANRW